MSKIEEIPQGADVTVVSKDEKKARELIKKLNLKQVKGITRVTFKQRGNLIYAIDSPDVYRSAGGMYVVFGEAKVDDMNQRIQEAQQQQQEQASQDESSEQIEAVSGDKGNDLIADLEKASLEPKIEEAEEDEEDVDESGLDSKDIDIIIEQTQTTRAKAVKALRKNDGDMVNAIMDLQ